MTAHKHATLMAEYAKDALETDKPWERWEFRVGDILWKECQHSPNWGTEVQYRRKRIPLCTIEGRDVFAGDLLFHKNPAYGRMTAEYENQGRLTVRGEDGLLSTESLDDLSWSEPPRTKTVYQWAFLRGNWQVSVQFYETVEQARKVCVGGTNFRRLDHTALEVPCDD